MLSTIIIVITMEVIILFLVVIMYRRRSVLTNFRCFPLSFLTRIHLIFSFLRLLKPLPFKSNLHYHCMIAFIYLLYNKNRCTIIYDGNYYNILHNNSFR